MGVDVEESEGQGREGEAGTRDAVVGQRAGVGGCGKEKKAQQKEGAVGSVEMTGQLTG